ncbi:MAG: DUF5615 family PIN-like protein [Acidobacteria bacterium]|nr:DUF5615 family PIN-like protein [Acidobacteriota bacterium]
MRFLVDECTGPAVARWLRSSGHDVYSVFEESRGSDDDDVMKKAFEENRILITNDKDFGEKVYREGKSHHGIILLRLSDERSPNKIERLRILLEENADTLQDQYVVVTESKIKFAGRRLPDDPNSST